MPAPALPDPATGTSAVSDPVARVHDDTLAPRLVLAFDFGRRRIGVACGDTLSRTARPLSVIANTGKGALEQALDSLVREWQPALIVVGLPYNVDDTESVMSEAARNFGREIESRHRLPVHLVDERYSSLEAATRLQAERESGSRKRRVARGDIDATAACVILERFFLQTP